MFRQFNGLPSVRLISIVTLEEAACFKLLDGYARSHHRCFLAEMDLNAAKAHYTLCFRPTGVENSPNRYACRYLSIGAEEVATAGQTHALPTSVTEMLVREPPTLPQS
jgi:hypothetical protein